MKDVVVDFSDDELASLDKHAAQMGMSRVEFIRKQLIREIKRREHTQKEWKISDEEAIRRITSIGQDLADSRQEGLIPA